MLFFSISSPSNTLKILCACCLSDSSDQNIRHMRARTSVRGVAMDTLSGWCMVDTWCITVEWINLAQARGTRDLKTKSSFVCLVFASSITERDEIETTPVATYPSNSGIPQIHPQPTP